MATVWSLFESTSSVAEAVWAKRGARDEGGDDQTSDAPQEASRLRSWLFPDRFWRVSLQRSARRGARGPGPLKIEAAEVAGHVDDFADEE